MGFSRFAVTLLVFAALAGASAVGLSAYASHGLDAEHATSLFMQASDFQLKHTLALILVTLISERAVNRAQTVLRGAAGLLAAGTILFPTALYSSALGGPVWWAPYGGIAAILGWLALGLGAILVGALAALPPHLQEMALDELLLLRDSTAIDPLEGFLLKSSASKMGVLEKAMQALLAIPDERTVEVLHNVLIHAESPQPLRKGALGALKNSPYPSASERLTRFRQLAPNDPLAKE